jgi:hypothetical protein
MPDVGVQWTRRKRFLMAGPTSEADPESAPFAVMGILAGAAGRPSKLEKTFADAATARKVLTDTGAMGRRFKEVDDKYQKVMGR